MCNQISWIKHVHTIENNDYYFFHIISYSKEKNYFLFLSIMIKKNSKSTSKSSESKWKMTDLLKFLLISWLFTFYLESVEYKYLHFTLFCLWSHVVFAWQLDKIFLLHVFNVSPNFGEKSRFFCYISLQ